MASWWGRWGSTISTARGSAARLAAIGQGLSEPWMVRARDWLESCQNEDGAGGTCASYDDPRLKGRGPSTPHRRPGR